MAVSEEHSYERKQGSIAYRLLQGIVPVLRTCWRHARRAWFRRTANRDRNDQELNSALAQKATSTRPDDDL